MGVNSQVRLHRHRKRHHLGKHAPMCPVRRNAMNRRIWAVRQPRAINLRIRRVIPGQERERAVNPRIIRQHMQSAARHIAAKHLVRRIPRLPLVRIPLRCHIRARGIKHAPHFRQIRLRRPSNHGLTSCKMVSEMIIAH